MTDKEKLAIAVEALEFLTTCHIDGGSFCSRCNPEIAKEALSKIRGE